MAATSAVSPLILAPHPQRLTYLEGFRTRAKHSLNPLFLQAACLGFSRIPILRTSDVGSVSNGHLLFAILQCQFFVLFSYPRPVDTFYGTVSSIFTIRLFSIELVFTPSPGGCLVDRWILRECIKCHYVDVTGARGGGPTNGRKISWKSKHFLGKRAPDIWRQ